MQKENSNKYLEFKNNNLKLQKLKIFVLISIIVFSLNILIFGSIYFSLHISRNDLNKLNDYSTNVNNLLIDLENKNRSLNNLNNQVGKTLVKLNNNIYNVELGNSRHDSQIIVLGGR